jgi:hypothetical protein
MVRREAQWIRTRHENRAATAAATGLLPAHRLGGQKCPAAGASYIDPFGARAGFPANRQLISASRAWHLPPKEMILGGKPLTASTCNNDGHELNSTSRTFAT